MLCKPRFLICQSGVILAFILSSCSISFKKQRLYSEPITSQKNSPVITYVEPTQYPPPQYTWSSPKHFIITPYAFHCHGTGSELITESKHIFDCEGLKHSLYKDFFINPRLVNLARHLQQAHPVQILEGFCCPKHFSFLQHLGKNPSKKLLSGEAIVLALPNDLSMDHLLTTLTSFYKHKPTPTTQFVQNGSLIQNHEFAITCINEDSYLRLVIELL